MTVRYHPAFLQKLKKMNVRIRKHFKLQLTVFTEDPFDQQLNNHPLGREYSCIL